MGRYGQREQVGDWAARLKVEHGQMTQVKQCAVHGNQPEHVLRPNRGDLDLIHGIMDHVRKPRTV